MNLYQLITGGLNEVKEEIACEKKFRVKLEQRVSILERRTSLRWTLLVVLLSLLISLAVVVVQNSRFPQNAENTIVVTNFTFSLHDSWLNYVLQQVTSIHLEQKENFSTWGITWLITGILEKAAGKEIFNLSVTAGPSQQLATIMPEIQVLFLDEDGQPLTTDNDFIPFLTNVSDNVGGVDDIMGRSAAPFVRSIDIRSLRKMNFIKRSIGVALYVRRSK